MLLIRKFTHSGKNKRESDSRKTLWILVLIKLDAPLLLKRLSTLLSNSRKPWAETPIFTWISKKCCTKEPLC